jgi:hypothetical protein
VPSHLSRLRRRAAERYESRTPARPAASRWEVLACLARICTTAKHARRQTHALFREVNERVKEVNEGFSLVIPMGDWICECANDTCVERITLSTNEYEAVRRDQARFFVAPTSEHVWPEVEHVIERNNGYLIVEYIGYSATAEAPLDPLRVSRENRGEAR